uniref:Uncharacterized protein n=1 Tax=Capitella teleta TaxID=283909 RepID=X2AH07_CAPTE
MIGLGDFIDGVSPCENFCDDTFPLHTYDTPQDLSKCQWGCRLYSIIDLAGHFEELNETGIACSSACTDAYGIPPSEQNNPCSQGCTYQHDTAMKRKIQMDQYYSQQMNQLSAYAPLLYVHSIYSNMVDKLQNHVAVSWSFYAESDSGSLVVIKSEPHIFIDGMEEQKNYETNLAALENSANLKHSQLERGLDGSQEEQTDWLSCISRKTGVSRMCISVLILMSALVMVWLCLTVVVTAPDHRVKPQKLSIYGDLEYLKDLDDKPILSTVHPQFEAGPLPMKIPMEAI